MAPPLHIALCTDGIFPHALGGMQRHSRLLAEHLARSGAVRLTVLHPHAVPVFDPALGITELPIAPIDPARLYLRELWRYSGRMADALDRLRPDVILSQGFSVWQRAARFSDRLIVHPHGLEMFQGLTWKDRLIGLPFRLGLRRIARRSRTVISLGGRLTPILEGLVEGSGARVQVIPNAVELRQEGGDDEAEGVEGPLTLLFVGRFAPNKGIDLLLTVARRLHAEGLGHLLRFRLAGDGPERPLVEAAAAEGVVELLGRVDDERLQQLYVDCHLLVLPTRFEGMPTVVLEAMAHARPVLVSDVGASAELVDDRNGRLLPPGDADALYHAVRWAMDLTPAQRKALGRASLERVRERFTWSQVAQQFVELSRNLH